MLTAASVTALAGCGEDDAEAEREVRAAAVLFLRAIAERDYAQVCRMVTSDVRKSWADLARRNPKLFSTAGCSEFARDFYRRGVRPAQLRRDIAKIERSTIRVDGDRATITADERDRRAGQDYSTPLEKAGGRWLLDD